MDPQSLTDRHGITRRSASALGGLLLVGTILRGIGLTRWSLWLDEITSIALRSQGPLTNVLFIPYDPHPPMYFLLLRGWLNLAGESALAARTFSVIISVGAILAMYALGQQLYDRQTGLIAALLLAVLPAQIHFGWIARMYSLVTLLTICSCYGFIRLGERRPLWSGFYILTTTALLYTHIYGIFVLAGQALHWLVQSETVTRKDWRHPIVTQAGIGLLFLPWLVVMQSQLMALLEPGAATLAVNWIPELSVDLLRDTFHLYAGDTATLYPIMANRWYTHLLAGTILLVSGVVVPLAIWKWQIPEAGGGLTISPRGGFLTSVMVAVIGLPAIISLVVTPIYFPRFTLPAMVPAVLLTARGLQNLPLRHWRIVLLGMIVISSLGLTASYYTNTTAEPWDEMVAMSQTVPGEDGVVLVRPAWAHDFYTYFDDERIPAERFAGEDVSLERLRSVTSDHPSVCLFEYGDPVILHEKMKELGYRSIEHYRRDALRMRCYGR